MIAVAMLAPLHFLAAAPQSQRHRQTPGVFVQHPHIELHDVPADDRVGVMASEPVVELFQQQRARLAVFELEVDFAVVAIGRAEHVHLTLATAFQGDGIQISLRSGFDVQRDQPQTWSIARVGLHLRIEQQPVSARCAAKAHRRGDEALHHVAFRWAHVGLEHLNVCSAQRGFQAHQLPMLAAIQAEHRSVFEIQQGQRFEFDMFLVVQQRLGLRALAGRQERHRRLMRQANAPGTAIGRQPELDFRTRGGIAPMPGQDEALR
ncbi:hypothetical protein PS712_06064 [Pseudomonas fluorescens]|nr:hypothetical protein PS712_06038 [Pseudomonas fluorescens]VVO42936.1 hypothetical protein PS712_06064 [Pseudomonas fluorescens]